MWSESMRTKNWRRVREREESAADDRGRAARGRGEGGELEEEGRADWSLRILVGFMGRTRTASSA